MWWTNKKYVHFFVNTQWQIKIKLWQYYELMAESLQEIWSLNLTPKKYDLGLYGVGFVSIEW